MLERIQTYGDYSLTSNIKKKRIKAVNLIDERKEKQIPDASDYTTLQNIFISLNLVSIVEQRMFQDQSFFID